MKAIILQDLNEPLSMHETVKPTIEPNEVLVALNAAALNHRDLWIQKGQYAGIRFPIILGSDGSGIVSEIGANVDKSWLNKEVVINAGMNWGNNPRVQAKDYVILGTPHDGTFAEYVKVDARLLYEKPKHLNFEQAAAFPLAGLTAFRATLKRAQVQAQESVLITGIGGGVALFALQFAVAKGCHVFVSSGDDEKIRKAIQLGAKGGVNYKDPNWAKNQGRAHGSIVDDFVEQFPNFLIPAKKQFGHFLRIGRKIEEWIGGQLLSGDLQGHRNTRRFGL